MEKQQQQQSQQSQQQQQSNAKKRCAQCKCKLGGVKFECKCKQVLCVNHLGAAAHACTYDYRAEGLKDLSKQLDTEGLGEKITKI